MLRRDDNGEVSALMECPHRENYAWHRQARPDGERHFHCADCFAGFTYAPWWTGSPEM